MKPRDTTIDHFWPIYLFTTIIIIIIIVVVIRPIIIIIRELIRGGEGTWRDGAIWKYDATWHLRATRLHLRLEQPQILFPVLPERERWEKCQGRCGSGKAHNAFYCWTLKFLSVVVFQRLIRSPTPFSVPKHGEGLTHSFTCFTRLLSQNNGFLVIKIRSFEVYDALKLTLMPAKKKKWWQELRNALANFRQKNHRVQNFCTTFAFDVTIKASLSVPAA